MQDLILHSKAAAKGQRQQHNRKSDPHNLASVAEMREEKQKNVMVLGREIGILVMSMVLRLCA